MAASENCNFKVVLIRPPGYLHTEGLRDIAETLHHSLRRMGAHSSIAENVFSSTAQNIVLGGHLLSATDAAKLPTDSIIYNLEQVDGGIEQRMPGYLRLLSMYAAWDYSARNLERLAALIPGVRATLMPIGFVPELSRVKVTQVQDIDVLFYGSINPRRRAIVDALGSEGLQVQAAFGVYGRERDALIARAKLVLNLHFYESHVFELVRVSYLLANRKAVVAECGFDTEIEDDLREAIVPCDYSQLVDTCLAMLADDARREALENHGHEIFRRRTLERVLSSALGIGVAPDFASQAAFPFRLNLGSGKDFQADSFNIDVNDRWRPDVVEDIAKLTLPCEVSTERFGRVTLFEHAFDEIVANDVLEHIPDMVAAMETCLKLLKIGGEFHIKVPYDLSYGAWQDPTHVRGFNEKSWLYFTDWCWYLGWTEYRFDVISLTSNLNELGINLQKKGMPIDELLRTPRAVDDMLVVLRKRMLTDEERALALGYLVRRQPGSPS